MKLYLAFLPILILSVPAFADGFGANDKVLYFKSDVLIDVIKKTFPENLQLNVAQKYVDLMDANGNVSVNDLISVCKTGALNTTKCRDFIQDLLNTTNTDIKPFYWADYVGQSHATLGIMNSIDGYFNDYKSIGIGGWALKFPWTDNVGRVLDFQRMYPGSNAIIGTSACTSDAGTSFVADATKNYTAATANGEHCWCKMTGPEETSWVYLHDYTEYNIEYGAKTNCARSCSLGCLGAMYGDRAPYYTKMQSAMFTAVKLNKSIANISDENNTIEDDLINEFKPCEFDWTKITENNLHDNIWWQASEQHTASLRKRPKYDAFTRYNFYSSFGRCNINYAYNERQGYHDEYSGCKPNQIKNIHDEFIAHYSFMNNEDFQCKYPGVKYLRGVAACTNDGGYVGESTNKQYTPNENTGPFCWCKITSPETSKWVLSWSASRDEYIRRPFVCIDFCVHACNLYTEYELIKNIKQ